MAVREVVPYEFSRALGGLASVTHVGLLMGSCIVRRFGRIGRRHGGRSLSEGPLELKRKKVEWKSGWKEDILISI